MTPEQKFVEAMRGIDIDSKNNQPAYKGDIRAACEAFAEQPHICTMPNCRKKTLARILKGVFDE